MWLFLLFTVEIPLFLHVKEAACQCVGATPLFKRCRPPELPEANYSPVFCHQGFQGRSLPHFPKRITFLFSAPKILTAVFLIWGNPEKIAFPSSFPLMLLSGATPLFKRGRPRELPEANYSPVFRHQGFQGRSLPHFPKQITLLFSAPKILTAVFLIWGNP